MAGRTVTIDGAFGEGGGQILRTSVGLAAALWGGGDGPEVLRIENIRANRPKPGLGAQHLVAVRAAAAVVGGKLAGARIGSRSLEFRPGGARSGTYRFEIGTAGSAMLVLQTILPALVVAEGNSDVTVTGGTHNPFAPCYEYFSGVFGVLAAGANVSLSATLERAGFYPAGGGQVRCQVRGLGSPEHVAGLKLLSRGTVKHIEGVSGVSESLPVRIAVRQAAQAIARLRKVGIRCSIEQAHWPTPSPGTVLFLRAVFSRSVAGFFALGTKGKPAERVADEAVDELLEFLDVNGAIDPHAADQLITLLALSPEASELATTKITQHLLTNAEVIRQIAGREVTVTGKLGTPGHVTIGG